MDTKSDNFKRISESRVSKIMQLLAQLRNLTNTSFYEYSEDDIHDMFDLIEKELQTTKKTLLEAKTKKKRNKFEL